MSRQRRILLIGPAPSNIGGVSIHIHRLISLLKSEYDFDIIDEGHKRWPGVFNLRSLNLFRYINKIRKADVVHIHSGTVMLRVCNIIAAKILCRKPTIVTVHRDPSVEKYQSLTRRMLSFCDKVITVSQKGQNILSNAKHPERYITQIAFLPPDITGEKELDAGLRDWIKGLRDKSIPLMASNAGVLVFKNGIDLYGLDMCVDAAIKLNENGWQCGLLFVASEINGNENYIKQQKDKISAAGFADRMLIITQPLSFVRLINEVDIILRPTITDGDAITVREAIYYHKPVVASDAVVRPEGVTLHKSRDLDSLIEAIKSLDSHEESQTQEITDYQSVYTEIYNSL